MRKTVDSTDGCLDGRLEGLSCTCLYNITVACILIGLLVTCPESDDSTLHDHITIHGLISRTQIRRYPTSSGHAYTHPGVLNRPRRRPVVTCDSDDAVRHGIVQLDAVK